jgi:hypothetical protein
LTFGDSTIHSAQLPTNEVPLGAVILNEVIAPVVSLPRKIDGVVGD